MQRLQHPLFLDALQALLQKIDLQCLLAHLTLQLGYPTFAPAPLAYPWKRVLRTLPELTSPTVQHARFYLQSPRYLSDGYPLL